MGVETEPLPADTPLPSGISHRRILVEMVGVIAFGAIAGLVFGGVRFGIGIIAGGVLAFLNYYWLKRSTTAVFEKAFSGGSGRFLTLRFVGRYAALGVLLLGIHLSGILPVAAVILGLAAFAFAVVIDAFVSIFRGNI